MEPFNQLMRLNKIVPMKLIASFLTVAFFYSTGFCQVRLPRLISDGMILQRDAAVKLWGWAAVNEKVKVKFKNKTYTAKTGADGKWTIELLPTRAGGPYTIEIIASNRIAIQNILFGDVWFCSGQSNMVHQMELHNISYAKEIEEANYPEIRQFLIPSLTNLQEPQQDFPSGSWKPATPTEVKKFSAVAYFFARQIYEKYHVPIGIINASVGGTPIEAWCSETGLKDFPEWLNTTQKNKDTSYVGAINRAAAMATKPTPLRDMGMTGQTKWFDTSYTPKGWRTINIPGYWEDQGIKELNGIVWYRKLIDIPASMAGKAAKVFLGRIVDADELYINGKLIGNTTYQYPQRRYSVPANLLNAGPNIFVIRVTNTNGKGGFVPDKPYCLFAGNDTIDLKGYWQYKVGEVFEPVKPGSIPMGISAQNQPTALFNGMVAPVVNYTLKGILWYQGESNSGRPAEYARLLPSLINDWRQQWKQQMLPFLYVQLPGFMEMNYLPSESQWAMLRESQLKSLSVPNTGMAVAIDLGEWNDIHPDNKKDVGERLALAAQKIAYGEQLVYSGPIYQSAKVQDNTIAISFTNIGGGLVTNDGEAPKEFAIAGADKKFVWAKVKIEGEKIIAWNDDVKQPMYIRYAWADNPVNPNLFNREGLPASPFRTDK